MAKKSSRPTSPLAEHLRRYEQLKAQLLKIGFICKGSLGEQWLTCGKPTCRCHDDPSQRHGPYFHLTWKHNGKTVGCYLSPDAAHLYREWIDNRHALEAVLNKMYAISEKAQKCVLPPPKAKKTSSRRSRKPR
jgi:hypothetical protein